MVERKYKMSKTFIIAEVSANHAGDKDIAKRIISIAKECGADAVKIQTYTADTLTIDCKSDIFLVKAESWKGQYLYDLYKQAYTPWEWQAELKAYADEIGIELFSTPFDKSSVDFLETLDVAMYKIASFEAIDYPLVEYVASKQKPMIISTGISSLDEIEEVINVCKSVGNDDITILKCTSSYPATLSEMNVSTIKDMVKRFAPLGVKVGLSDHSKSVIPAVTAVALGATVIEKHLMLDDAPASADSVFSLTPDMFKDMVNAVRDAEKALGEVTYTYNESNRAFARSLFAVKDIKAGEQLTEKNIRSIRPGQGLHPKHYNEVLGKVARVDIERGTPLSFEVIDENF